MSSFYLGVDIGGTFIKIGVVSSKGEVIAKEKFNTTNSLKDILKIIEKYLGKYRHEYKIKGIGISLPGVISSDGVMQTAGSLKNLIGLNVKELAQVYLNLPVEIITDSKAVALAEGWMGNGQIFSNYVCVTLGSAIGGSIVIDNQLYWGLSGLAGEFGVSLMGRENKEYKLDSTSLHAGVVGGLCRKYGIAVKKEINDASYIFKQASGGDVVAKRFVDEFLDDVSRMLVNISVYLAPEVILLGGGISDNRHIMLLIQEAYNRIKKDYRVLSLVNMPKILPCQLGNDAGMIGAVKRIIDVI